MSRYSPDITVYSLKIILDCCNQASYNYIMQITAAEIYQLKIPFRMNFSHSKADRFFSDSIILRIEGSTPGGEHFTGWGEAVVREYVSGEIAGPEELLASAGKAITELLAPFREKHLNDEEVIELLRNLRPAKSRLPLLCAAETAILDLMCRARNTDIYSLLGTEPRRTQIVYGGTLPMLPLPAAEKLLLGYKQMKIGNLRIKIGKDIEYNRRIIGLARDIMGPDYDLKTDTNAGWSLGQAVENLRMLKEFGIRIVEEPFGREEGRGQKLINDLCGSPESEGMVFMADESALTEEDIRAASEEKTFGMINIRLAKNGGLLKSLDMAETAEKLGIRYMCGCHVGETGILSATGRVAASLMKNPEYTDGSYDSHLLSGNITTEDLSFGPGGHAGIIRDREIGFRIDETRLEGFTNERIRCF